MTNTISFVRLRPLIRKQWIESRKIFTISTVILFGAVALAYVAAILTSQFVHFGDTSVTLHNAHRFFRFSSLDFRAQVIMYSGLFYLTLLSGHYFFALGKSATSIQELTLPVSAAERTIVAFLLSTMLMILAFVLTFLLVDALFVVTLKAIYHDAIRQADEIQRMHRFADNVYGFPYVLQVLDRTLFAPLPIIGFLLSSVFALGSVYFPRYPYISTAFATIGVLVLVVMLYVAIENVFFAGLVHVSEEDGKLNHLFGWLIVAAVASIWVATYFRLKEKEV